LMRMLYSRLTDCSMYGNRKVTVICFFRTYLPQCIQTNAFLLP